MSDHAPADILRKLLVDQGYGSDPFSEADWPIYHMSLPEETHNSIVVADTVGVKLGRGMAGESLHRDGFQIRVRSTSPVISYKKAETIRKYLDTVKNQSVSMPDDEVAEGGPTSTTYKILAITQSSSIIVLPRETKVERFSCTMNGTVNLEGDS